MVKDQKTARDADKDHVCIENVDPFSESSSNAAYIGNVNPFGESPRNVTGYRECHNLR